MKKFISMLLVGLMCTLSLVSAVGCGSVTEDVETDKTQLYVNVLEKGAGTDFAYSLKSKFEAKYAERSFEDGKTGVQVIISTDEVDKDTIETALQSNDTDVYYLINFAIKDLVNLTSGQSDLLEDITDIVTKNGNSSIHNRMFESTREYYNVGTDANPKYFALPWFTSYYGTVYDVGLFKEQHLYSTDAQKPAKLVYEGLDGQVGTDDDNYGPDGKTGTKDNGDGTISDYTLDDGLPATWKDFTTLMGVMKSRNITPFVFTNKDSYPESWLQALWIDYEGKDNYELVKSFDGSYVYKDASGAMQSKAIDQTNGYEVAYQQGKKTAIYVASQMVKNGWCEELSFDQNTDKDVAHDIFLYSKTNGKYAGNDYPVAMLLEGTWWENESKNTFEDLANSKYGGAEYAYGVREFGYMPFPKFIEGDGVNFNASANTGKITLRSGGVGEYSSSVLINKKSEKKELAKLFLEFAYSEEMLIDFNVNAGVTVPMNYQMNETDMAKLTPFQRNIYQLTQNDNVEVVSGANRSTYMIKAPDKVSAMVEFTSIIGTDKTSAVLSAFKKTNGLTANQYWEGLTKVGFEGNWLEIIG